MPECLAKEKLQQLLAQSPDNLIIIDVRTPEEYVTSHIPIAVNIPIHDLEKRTKEFKRDTIMVTVCGKGGGRSAKASEFLKEMGFNRSYFLSGGTFGWLGIL